MRINEFEVDNIRYIKKGISKKDNKEHLLFIGDSLDINLPEHHEREYDNIRLYKVITVKYFKEIT